MSELYPWIERKFAFAFPVALHPSLRVRVRGTPARLEELVRDLAPDALVCRLEGKWSIQENAGHLLSVEELWTTRLREFLAGAERLTAAEMTGRRTEEARHNQRPIAEILKAFRASRIAWVDSLDALRPEDFARTALHPRLGVPMRLVDHLTFAAEHDDHHLARIWELRRLLAAAPSVLPSC